MARQRSPEAAALAAELAAEKGETKTALPSVKNAEGPLPFEVVRETHNGVTAVFLVYHTNVQNPASGLFMRLPMKQYVGAQGSKGSPVPWGWPLVEMVEKTLQIIEENKAMKKELAEYMKDEDGR